MWWELIITFKTDIECGVRKAGSLEEAEAKFRKMDWTNRLMNRFNYKINLLTNETPLNINDLTALARVN